ncbi:MAG: SulP family inorganic anion transporter, partial [Anaerolineales bacterium]
MKISWSRDTLSADLGAALSVALVSIPEGMAYALVAGVNPIYGLYTGMISTIVASLTTSTTMMVVTLTNALALVTGEQIAGLSGDADPIRAMFTLTLLVGVIMFVLGALKLGSAIRFVSREVMSGFVFATALLIVLGQYKDLVGYVSQLEANKLFKAVDITLHVGDWNFATMIVGIASIIVLILLKRSPVKKWADILIILLATLFVLVTRWQEVELVGDISAVPSGLAALPAPGLPDFNLIPLLFTGAFAAAVVGLAESSGAGAAYPNPDGTRSNMSLDFSGQGLGNIAGSFFQAMPAGGSLSRTGINASGGARSRWAGVYSGLLIAIVLMLFGHFAELIPMAGLAGLLIVIGFDIMFREGRELAEAWNISRLNTVVAVITILVGVFSDLTVAIFTGVILSLLLYTFSSANKFKIVKLERREDGAWAMQPLPEQIASNQATVIELRGNAFFASVYSFDELFPNVDQASNAIVILRLRDRSFASLTSL